MDYSLLVGIHNLDQAAKEKAVNIMTFFYITKMSMYICLYIHTMHIHNTIHIHNIL